MMLGNARASLLAVFEVATVAGSRRVAVLAIALLLVTGCGGGGDNVPACVAGQACTPSGTPLACKTYATACDASGAQTCVAANKADGSTCGTGLVCGGGTCNACVANEACASTTACHVATLACTSGFPVCADTGALQPDGTSCGGVNTCAAGLCQAPCPPATVKVPATGTPAWSADFAAWMSAHGFTHVAANQGWGGGAACGTSTRDPVILIHGNTAAVDPSTSMNGLKTQLLAGGYTDCDLFAISWIEQNANTSVNHHKASYLKLVRDFIEAVQGYTGKSQVDVVGWSMGVTIARKAIQGGTAFSDPVRATGCDLGPSMSAGIDTLLGVAGLNRGMALCAGSTSNGCSENGFRIDSAYLQDVNGGSAGTYAPAPVGAHVYSIYLPDDEYMCGDSPRGLGSSACEVFGVHTSRIPAEEFSRSYDLFNENYGNTTGLNFNCTVDANGRSFNCDHILVFSDAFSLEGMVRMIRDNETATLPAPPFSQADLTGAWDMVLATTNDSAGWWVASLTVDGAGQSTFSSYRDSSGSTALPPSSPVFAVDDNGVVTLPGANGAPTFHGKLNAQKNLVIGNLTDGAGGTTSYGLFVLRKRTAGVTYAAADVASLAFTFHQIQTGGGSTWEYGVGSTDALGNLTIGSITSPTGPGTPPPAGSDALQISPDGLVTMVTDTTFHGVMTSDKKAIFGVRTQSGPTPVHVFMVSLSTGQTFVQTDLAGTYEFHGVTSGASAASANWLYGRVAIDNAGTAVFRYAKAPSGPFLPANQSLTLGANGTVTAPFNATYSGRMAWGKDFYVRTQTSSGANSLSIVVK
jgi:triacylglycerol lipase